MLPFSAEIKQAALSAGLSPRRMAAESEAREGFTLLRGCLVHPTI
jgi:hypothetical protein